MKSCLNCKFRIWMAKSEKPTCCFKLEVHDKKDMSDCTLMIETDRPPMENPNKKKE